MRTICELDNESSCKTAEPAVVLKKYSGERITVAAGHTRALAAKDSRREQVRDVLQIQ